MNTPTHTPAAIAIIGCSGRYPGGANNLDQLWKHLKQGVDGISPAKGDRWDLGYHDPDAERPHRIYAFEGGFLDTIDSFDAEFFGISPREARQVDPQQRLLLELAWEALEDANLVPKKLAGTNTAVFVGLSNHDYGDLSIIHTPDAYSNTGMALSIASNRISYILDLKGPSMTIDTACSSGMVSLHMACNSLLSGDADMALVGAANMLLTPLPWIGFSQASMLAPDSRCKSFDADGAGYVRAEGGGMLLLKPLAAAERDGDRILGVILATGVNSDGKTMGISLPSAEAQARLLREVYSKAGVSPDQVFYVEAHGTGTAVGDPIECSALGEILGSQRSGDTPLYIGSIKSNIGHLEPASGIAGITKILLSLKHREIPANLHFNTPNPNIDFAGWRLSVVDQPLALPDSAQPLVFGVNSFGFGGTNGHAVIQEYRAASKPADTSQATATYSQTQNTDQLLLISAQTPKALKAMAQQWLDYLRAHPELDWATLCAAAIHDRTQHACRLALRAATVAAAVTELEQYLADTPGVAVSVGRASATQRSKVAFVFSGNGPQWQGMACGLMAAHPGFAAVIAEVDAHFQPLAGWSLIDELQRDADSSRMALTEVAQPTLFALQVGLTHILRDAGIVPDAVFGHSVGEAAAAYASGALTLAQATAVIYHRSTGQAKTAGTGRMAALGVSAAEAEQAIARVLAEQSGFLEIAAINAPRAVTVAGSPDLLEQLCAELTEAGKFARMLTLDYPFHTTAMDLIRDELLVNLHSLQPGPCTVPFVSSVDGMLLQGEQLNAEYWWRNIREPVRFSECSVYAMQDLGIRHFIEIGPHPVLREYVNQSASGLSLTVMAVGTLRRPAAGKAENDLDNLWSVILAAHAHGMSHVANTYPVPLKHLELPVYPWQRERHWRGWNSIPDTMAPIHREHPLLGWRAGTHEAHWENTIDPNLHAWLLDHRVQDAPVFPAAAYLEVALSAAQRLLGDTVIDIENVDILKPMVISDTPVLQMNVDSADGTWEIRGRPSSPSPYHEAVSTIHTRGRLTKAAILERPVSLDLDALRENHPLRVEAASHYRETARRGLPYGPAFQGVQTVFLSVPDAENRSAVAEIVANSEIAAAIGRGAATPLTIDDGGVTSIVGPTLGYRAHPAVVDACLQVLISLLAQTEERPCAFIPVHVGRTRSYGALPSRVFCHVVLRSESARSGVADFVVADEHGQVLLTLTDARLQKVEFRNSATTMPRLVEHWRPDSSNAGRAVHAINLPAPDDVCAGLATIRQQILARHDNLRCERDLYPRLNALLAAYACDALQALGAQGNFTLGRLQRRTNISDEQAALLESLLQLAQCAGAAVEQEGMWRFMPVEQQKSADSQWLDIWRDYPAYARELMLLARIGENLPLILRAEVTIPDSALDVLLEGAPCQASMSELTAAALAQLLTQWPAGRPVRILELAGRQGAITTTLLPLLPACNADYVFSDSQQANIDRVAQRFAGTHVLRTQLLDLHASELNLQASAGCFDIVICAHTLPGSPDNISALRHVHTLLAPGGYALIAAAQAEAFNRFIGIHGQQLSSWRDMLEQAGFHFSVLADGSEHYYKSLLLAQKPAKLAVHALTVQEEQFETGSQWLVLSDANPRTSAFAQQLATQLSQRDYPANFKVFDEVALTAQLQTGVQHIVHVVGLDSSTGTADAELATAQLRCASALTLIQTLEALAPEKAPKLHFVTHAAMAAPGGEPALDPAQIALWGFVRVASNEHARYAPKLIDLHAGLDAAGARLLLDELIRKDAETEVLLTADQRYVHRMELAGEDDCMPPVDKVHALRLDSPAQGGLDGLTLRRLERRAPARDEVEIAVRAAGLNYRDVLWAMGMLPEEAVEHGFSGATIGMECSGTVTAVGSEVTDFKPGDRVIAFATACFASHVTTKAIAVVHMPQALNFEEAATIPTAFLTAFYALHYLARLEPGETVLIHGAAGGVGLAALQVAKLCGAEVFATAGNEDKRRLLRLLGADHVLDSRSLAYADEVMRITNGNGVDVVLNSLAGEAITKNLQILRPFGRMLEIGKRDLYANSRIGLRPFRNNLSYFGIDADTLLIERPALARSLFRQLMDLFDTKSLRPLPYQAVPVQRAAQAFRLMQQSRHVGKILITLPLPGETLPAVFDEQLTLRADATYLVTGGLGGFGLATARWLVARGARHLALLSRSGAGSDEAQAGIAVMRATGASVRAFAADVTRAEDLAQVLGEIRTSMPPLRGVVHAAMVLDDAPVVKLDAQRIQQVLAPKILGAWHLHEQTQHDQLDHFVMFSSGTTTIGNPGQANYVAANLYLEGLALWRRQRGLPALAVGWGGIQDVGVLTRSADLQTHLQARSGVHSVSSAAALQELGRLMALGFSRVCVAPFNLQRMAQLMPLARTLRFRYLTPQAATEAGGQSQITLAERLRELAPDARRAAVIETLCGLLGRILGTGAAQVDVSRPLSEMGLDSLMAVELADSLENELGRPVSVMQMLQAGNVNAIADMLMAAINAGSAT